jgi:hypothetical protein
MKLTSEQLVRCKKFWIATVLPKAISDDIDESNLGRKRLIGIEGTLHPKTSQPKTFVEEWGNWLNNIMPKEIIEQASKEQIQPQVKNTLKLTPRRCAFLEYCLHNRINLQNKQQNSHFSPNAFAYFQDNEALQQLVETQQAENLSLARLKCWEKYNPEFNCKQVQKFAGSIGKRAICDLCLLGARE